MTTAIPKLRLGKKAPLTAAICWCYAIANIGLGLGMYWLYQPSIPISVADIFSYDQWGFIFLIIGIVGLYAMICDKQNLARIMQICGFMVKTWWGIALVIRCLEAPQTILITIVWITLACIQGVTYFYWPRSELKPH